MKDYSLNYDDSKKFILSYKIENGKIIAKFANGDLFVIPYSEENENKIISKMEEQARNAKVKEPSPFDLILMITQPLCLPFAIRNFINNVDWFYGIILGIIASGAIWYPAKVIALAKRKSDIDKLRYFLEHKDELNESIVKSENAKLGLSEKTIKQIELQKSENKEPFNINNIDNYSLNDLKTIKENIERIASFGFNEEQIVAEDTLEEKSPVLKKTLNNKR